MEQLAPQPTYDQPVRVELTLDHGSDDREVLRTQGPQARRQHKILRLSEEAEEQGGILTQEDLGRLLQVSSRTIRSDIAVYLPSRVNAQKTKRRLLLTTEQTALQFLSPSYSYSHRWQPATEN
jgi:Fic family protein